LNELAHLQAAAELGPNGPQTPAAAYLQIRSLFELAPNGSLEATIQPGIDLIFRIKHPFK